MATGTDRADLRIFGLTLSGVCVVWAVILYWREAGGAGWWLFGAAAALAALALAAPTALRPVHAAWMPAGRGIARALTWLLLTIVFVVVITPYGLVTRLLRKDPLERKIDRSRPSYWHRRTDGPFDRERMKKQY